MYLVICCDQYLKFSDLWDFKKHLVSKHGYSEEAANQRILDFIEEQKWKVA